MGRMQCMAFWWEHESDENLFMEITRRDDVGVDLKAPLAARGGVDTPGYALVNAVKAGDVIIHYDSAAEQIVGVSRATGERTHQPLWWASRGTYARKAGVKPRWLAGMSVELEGYEPLAEPVSLATIRTHRAALLGLRANLQAQHAGQPIYFPWIPYQSALRTFQTYLAKFPRAALELLPELKVAVEGAESAGPHGGDQPEIAQAEGDIAAAAGRPRPPRAGRGQGFSVDQGSKVAVEAYAMNDALDYYEKLGEVVDTSRNQSYDYAVNIDGQQWHVEVKGTTGAPAEVLLTPNEVTHAAEYPYTALYVLSNVVVTQDGDGEITTSGGRATVLHPWKLDPSQLTPLGFRYRLQSDRN